jgi:hypothetical protein
MTLVLQEDFHHLLTSEPLDNNSHFQLTTYELQVDDPRGISHGYRRWLYLRPGISVLLEKYNLQENLVIEYLPHQPSNYLELGFHILGHDFKHRSKFYLPRNREW